MFETPATPKKIDRNVRNFCFDINPDAKPVFVDVRPEPDCTVNECFHNVLLQIRRHGGSSLVGWAIWYLAERFIEAEFHCVWQLDGELLDITPKKNRERRVLFVPDEKMAWKGKRVPNIKRALSDDPIIDWFIRKAEAHDELDAKYVNSNGQSVVPIYLMQEVEQRFSIELNKLVAEGKVSGNYRGMPQCKTGRNDPCPCGSGKKYKRCHG